MRLDQEFSVTAPAERVWAFLMNVPEMAACIPGASDVRELDDRSYEARVKARIGPVSAAFGCTIAIVSLDEHARTGIIDVRGKDAKIGGVNARMTMDMHADGDTTTVRVGSDVDVMGKIGQYGHGMIAKRAAAMLDDFAACVRGCLES